jgi:ABC-type amino acid transport substrate-binding protein
MGRNEPLRVPPVVQPRLQPVGFVVDVQQEICARIGGVYFAEAQETGPDFAVLKAH